MEAIAQRELACNNSEITSSSFDYAELAPEIAAKLKTQAEDIRKRISNTVEDIIAIGKVLRTTKDDLLEHGQFLCWIKTELGISPSTAQRWMRVADLSKSVSLTHLTPDAAYHLTAKDATPEIVSTVTSKAAGGEIVPAAAVKEMVANARDQRTEAEAQARRAEKLRKMSRRKREQRERQQREYEAARRQEKKEASAAAAALIGRFGREGAGFILDAFVAHRFELEAALEAALGRSAS